MSERVDVQRLEERLSEATDRILAGERPGEGTYPGMEEQFRSYRAMVERLARLFPARQPDADLRNRIRARLTAEWNVSGPGSGQAGNGWRSSMRNRRVILTWGVVGVRILLLAGLWITPELLPAPTGAAGVQTGALVIGIVLLGIIALVLWWLKRRS
jgi:hypothetical protein